MPFPAPLAQKSGAAELSSNEKDKRCESLRCGGSGEKGREIKNGYLSLSDEGIDDDDDGSRRELAGGGRGRGKQGVIREVLLSLFLLFLLLSFFFLLKETKKKDRT